MNASQPMSNRTLWVTAIAFVTVIAAHAVGILQGITFPLVVAGALLCAYFGLRRNRPRVWWPWWALVLTAVLWGVAGVVREATGATGNLTDSRSLLPDLFALPGYALFAIALYGLLRARRGPEDSGARLDGIMLGAGALLLVDELLVVPTLRIPGAWVMARVAIAIYPAISMCLLVLAARLAFSSWQPSPAFSLILVGTTFLLLGDIFFALGDAGYCRRRRLPTGTSR